MNYSLDNVYELLRLGYGDAYMTDILKDYPEMDSTNVSKYLRDNLDFEKQNVESFHQELDDIGSENPKLVAFGVKVYGIFN